MHGRKMKAINTQRTKQRWRQKLELCCPKSRNFWGYQRLKETRNDLTHRFQRKYGPAGLPRGLRGKESSLQCRR